MTEARTDPDLLYVGTYTENIYLVRMDRRSGELVRVGAVNAGANPSFLSIHPNGRVLYAVNELEPTGAVSAFAIERATGALTRINEEPSGGGAVMRPGAGPRHLAFHPTLPLVFVANELDSTVATLRFDSTRGALSPLDARPTVPAGWTGRNYPADIHVAASGRTLYVSNRGHNSIAVFSVAETTGGALALEQVVSTEGDWPRNFSLDPSGRWLLVANQRSDSVAVFGRDPDTGRLSTTPQRLALPSPVCLRFA